MFLVDILHVDIYKLMLLQVDMIQFTFPVDFLVSILLVNSISEKSIVWATKQEFQLHQDQIRSRPERFSKTYVAKGFKNVLIMIPNKHHEETYRR